MFKTGRRCQTVIDVTCQRASETLYETIAVSLFARLSTPALLQARGFAVRISRLQSRSCLAFFSTDFRAKERLLAVYTKEGHDVYFYFACSKDIQFNMNLKFWLSVAFLMSRIGVFQAAAQCQPAAEYSIKGMFLRGHTFKVLLKRNFRI